MDQTKNMKISIIGAGLMGQGIAMTFASVGFEVLIYDKVSDSLDTVKARIQKSWEALDEEVDASDVLERIELCNDISACVENADFVTEAVPEKLDLKQEIFQLLEANAPDDCILASNTSVIPITSITKNLKNRSRSLGTHWWNPAHLIPLVEVIQTEWTSAEAIEQTIKLLSLAGKTPVLVEKDVPGFIGNRLQHALWREAISLVENGICSAAAVDTVVKSSFGRRLAVLGPLENADLIGTDLTIDIHNNILSDLDCSKEPSKYLKDLVDAQKLGMKSGEGFHVWTAPEVSKLRSEMLNYLSTISPLLE